MFVVLLWLTIIGLVLVAFSATATLSLNEVAWHELEDYCKQKKRPQRFGQIFEMRDQLALGAGIFKMLTVAATTVTMTGLILESRAIMALSFRELASTITLLALCLVVVGSWIPWAVARTGASRLLFHTWPWWWGVSWIAWPLIVGARFVYTLIARAIGIAEQEEDIEAFEDEFLSMVSEGEHDGFLESDAREMIEGVMELDDKNVVKIMTHRSQVDALEVSTQWEDMLTFVVESGRTRIPVYEGKIDNVVGILYAKDLLRESLRSESKRRPLTKLLREPLVVPEKTLLDQMLSQFLHVRTHMAIVEDEYGGLAGVVTIEDVLEEIVGEIVDETDKDKSDEITILNPQQADVLGSVHIGHLNEVLGVELPHDDQFATVSGLIMEQLKEIPRPGHEFSLGQVQFNIQEANRRQIKSVRVTVKDDEESD